MLGYCLLRFLHLWRLLIVDSLISSLLLRVLRRLLIVLLSGVLLLLMMILVHKPPLVTLSGLLRVLGLDVSLRALTHAFIVLNHHEVLLMAFSVSSLGSNKWLILTVCIAVIVRDVVLTVTVGVVKRLSETFPEKLDKPLVRRSIFIKALKIESAEVVSETFDALEYLRAPTLQVASLCIPLEASCHHPCPSLCQLNLLLYSF